ncbi:hypothetical protein [Photobacterium leiognathi]|uniref:hypothetical protein n=1 Tax=Photobacterium leiognathi TaxID=553611 RepID=UPI002981ABD5|nr:hypothetical protein [Photobacterium leiognathi]
MTAIVDPLPSTFDRAIFSDNNNFLTAFWNNAPAIAINGVNLHDIELATLNGMVIHKHALCSGVLEENKLNALLAKVAKPLRHSFKNRQRDCRINVFLGLSGLTLAISAVNPILSLVGCAAIAVTCSKPFIRYLTIKDVTYKFYCGFFKGYQVNLWLKHHGFLIAPKAVKNYEMQAKFDLLQHCNDCEIVKLGTTKIVGFGVNIYNLLCHSDSGKTAQHLCFSVNLKSNTFAKPTLSTFSIETTNSDFSMFTDESAYRLCSQLIPQSQQPDLLDGHDYKVAVSDAIAFGESDILYSLNALHDHQPTVPFYIQKTDTHLYFALPIEMLSLANLDANFDVSDFNLIEDNQHIIATLIHLISKSSKARRLGEI